MNTKRAVRNVLEHAQPEFIPLGTYAIDNDTVERIIGHKTYVRDKAGIRIAYWEGRRDEVVQSLKQDSVELFKKLDCIDVIIPFKEAPLVPPRDYVPEKVRGIGENMWEGEDGTIYQRSELTNEVAVVQQPDRLYTRQDFENLSEFTAPDPTIFEALDYLVEHMKADRFLMGPSGGFQPMLLLNGIEAGLVEYYLRPELVRAALTYYTAKHNYLDDYYIHKDCDAVFVEDDFGGTNGPLMSPAMFRDFCLPSMKERIAHIKRYSDKVLLHCCGKTWKLLDMIVEAGVDGYQSLQTTAGMDLRLLKDRYGDELIFWGGVGVGTLICGTPEDVRREVRNAMQHGARNGGFILGPSHSIAYGTRYDNFMALLDEHDKLKHQT